MELQPKVLRFHDIFSRSFVFYFILYVFIPSFTLVKPLFYPVLTLYTLSLEILGRHFTVLTYMLYDH